MISTALTELVGVRHPIVQTGMGWVAGPRLVAATAEAGGLGILASATMTYDQLVQAIEEVKGRTTAPFGVNLRADAADASDRIDLLIAEGVRVASFALAPKREFIERLKAAGAVVVPSIGAAKHARKVAEWGADAVIVQGGEGGGHTGGVATTLLLPSVLDAVDIPVIAAGGFFDGRGLAAALAYGAAGIAMGTRFLLTKESTVPDEVKRVYLGYGLDGTVVTKRVDGMPHRVLRTDLVRHLEDSSPVSRPRARDPQRRPVPVTDRAELARAGARGAGQSAAHRAELDAVGDGGQHADAAQSRAGRGRHPGRRAREWPGGRDARRPPDLPRADRRHRGPGREDPHRFARNRPAVISVFPAGDRHSEHQRGNRSR